MSIINNHADFNKWQVYSGMKANNVHIVDDYLKMKKYSRDLKNDLSFDLKELIVKNINSQKGVLHISEKNITHMIDMLSTFKDSRAKKFDKLMQKDFFEAFRYLHKLSYR